MNTPEINTGVNVNPMGFGTRDILNFLYGLMAMKNTQKAEQDKLGITGLNSPYPTAARLGFLSEAGPGSPAQTFFNDTGITPAGGSSGMT